VYYPDLGAECQIARGPRVRAVGWLARAHDSSNILVPGEDVLYVAPGMIVHYVKDHAYAPPAEFCEAVLACAAPLTDEYYAALRRFVAVFSPPSGRPTTGEDFDRFAQRHRERRAQLVAAAVAGASRKRFTWD